MSVLAEHLILSQEKSLNSTHKRATLTGKVAGCLALEGCLKQIARANADAKSECAVESLAGSILVDSIRRVESAAFEEHRTERGARSLRCNHDNVDILLRNTTCAVVPSDSEAMREIERIARLQTVLQRRPNRHHCCIREQTHYDSTFCCCLLNREESLSRYPSVGDSLLESLALTLANDYVESVIAKVASLSRTLHAIADHCYELIFENLTCLFQRKLLTCHYLFDNATKIHFCHSFCCL